MGILSDATNRPDADRRPRPGGLGAVPYEAKDVEGVADGTPSTFAVMIPPRRGRWLQKRMAGAKEPFRVKVDIEAELPRDAGAGHGRGLDPGHARCTTSRSC